MIQVDPLHLVGRYRTNPSRGLLLVPAVRCGHYPGMQFAFLGTPELAAVCLRALLERAPRHRVVVVVTNPDRPAGRHGAPRPSPVKVAASEAGLDVLQPERVRARDFREALVATGAELGVTVAYGHIFRPRLLASLPRGFLNAHTSLLPRWRGASPIQAAIRAGDEVSGVTVMRMDEGMDTGDMLLWRETALTPDETSATLHDRLARMAAELLCEALDRLEDGAIEPTPQADSPYGPPSHCHILRKSDGAIDWLASAIEIDRHVRAFADWPGAFTSLAGERLLLRRVLPHPAVASGEPPGVVLPSGEGGLRVACGTGVLEILELQRAGRRASTAAEFLRGFRLPPGARCT